jgi:3-methyladenine DNA glycosylase AlkD
MTSQTSRVLLTQLESLADPRRVKGMERFGINADKTLGISMPILRKLAKSHRRDHEVALDLWMSGYHEARILAALIDDPAQLTGSQMEKWVGEFDSWDVCDQVCGGLFDKTTLAHQKIDEWSSRPEEFVKRAAFVLMASLAVHDKSLADGVFEKWLPIIDREASDDRNFVRKAVNWALRQIGKRDARLSANPLRLARRLSKSESRSARWIGKDAVRELEIKKTTLTSRK